MAGQPVKNVAAAYFITSPAGILTLERKAIAAFASASSNVERIAKHHGITFRASLRDLEKRVIVGAAGQNASKGAKIKGGDNGPGLLELYGIESWAGRRELERESVAGPAGLAIRLDKTVEGIASTAAYGIQDKASLRDLARQTAEFLIDRLRELELDALVNKYQLAGKFPALTLVRGRDIAEYIARRHGITQRVLINAVKWEVAKKMVRTGDTVPGVAKIFGIRSKFAFACLENELIDTAAGEAVRAGRNFSKVAKIFGFVNQFSIDKLEQKALEAAKASICKEGMALLEATRAGVPDQPASSEVIAADTTDLVPKITGLVAEIATKFGVDNETWTRQLERALIETAAGEAMRQQGAHVKTVARRYGIRSEASIHELEEIAIEAIKKKNF